VNAFLKRGKNQGSEKGIEGEKGIKPPESFLFVFAHKRRFDSISGVHPDRAGEDLLGERKRRSEKGLLHAPLSPGEGKKEKTSSENRSLKKSEDCKRNPRSSGGQR